MGAEAADREVQLLRVSVQETLYRDLRELRVRLASAEAALVDALIGETDAGTAHLVRYGYYEKVLDEQHSKPRARRSTKRTRL